MISENAFISTRSIYSLCLNCPNCLDITTFQDTLSYFQFLCTFQFGLSSRSFFNYPIFFPKYFRLPSDYDFMCTLCVFMCECVYMCFGFQNLYLFKYWGNVIDIIYNFFTLYIKIFLIFNSRVNIYVDIW